MHPFFHSFRLVALSLLGWMLLAPAAPHTRAIPSESPVTVDFCNLKGAVYVEEVESFANYKVFVEDVEAFADLLVFKEHARAFSDRPGLWHFTDVRAFADFSVSFTQVKSFADFSIFFTEFKSLAGCRN